MLVLVRGGGGTVVCSAEPVAGEFAGAGEKSVAPAGDHRGHDGRHLRQGSAGPLPDDEFRWCARSGPASGRGDWQGGRGIVQSRDRARHHGARSRGLAVGRGANLRRTWHGRGFEPALPGDKRPLSRRQWRSDRTARDLPRHHGPQAHRRTNPAVAAETARSLRTHAAGGCGVGFGIPGGGMESVGGTDLRVFARRSHGEACQLHCSPSVPRARRSGLARAANDAGRRAQRQRQHHQRWPHHFLRVVQHPADR